MQLGAMHVGIPVMPVSSAYSLMSSDHEKLRAVIADHDPSVIYVDDAAPFLRAHWPRWIRCGSDLVTNVATGGAEPLADLIAVEATGEVANRLGQIGPDTIARFC